MPIVFRECVPKQTLCVLTQTKHVVFDPVIKIKRVFLGIQLFEDGQTANPQSDGPDYQALHTTCSRGHPPGSESETCLPSVLLNCTTPSWNQREDGISIS